MTTRTVMLALAISLAGGCMPKVKALKADLAETEAQLEAARLQNQGYIVEVQQLRDEVRDLSRENAALSSYYDDMIAELAPRLESGDAQLIVYPDRSVIALSDEIAFSSGSAKLTSEGRDAVAELAALLKKHPERHFQIEGHTDAVPIHNDTYASNWELGAARAIGVAKALVDAGVPASQVSAATHAASSPIASNDSADGREANRRISIAFDLGVDEVAAHRTLLEKARAAGVARVVQDDGGARVVSK